VLPIGGVREKALAAQRAGLSTVVLPRENEPDLEELPEETREALSFVLADSLDDVLAAALDGVATRRRRVRAVSLPPTGRAAKQR
jgi:ATP-dependent Lon protease